MRSRCCLRRTAYSVSLTVRVTFATVKESVSFLLLLRPGLIGATLPAGGFETESVDSDANIDIVWIRIIQEQVCCYSELLKGGGRKETK